MKAIASNIEGLYLEPLLDTIWKTAVQHIDKRDVEWQAAIGQEWFQALLRSKKQFAKYHVRFHFRGISALIDKGQKVQKIMQLLQVIGQNQMLMQALMQDLDPKRLINYLFELFEVDKSRLFYSPREKQQNAIAQQQQQQAQAKQQLAQQMIGTMLGGSGGGRGGPPGAQAGTRNTPAGGLMPAAGPGGGQAAPTPGGPPPQGPRGG